MDNNHGAVVAKTTTAAKGGSRAVPALRVPNLPSCQLRDYWPDAEGRAR